MDKLTVWPCSGVKNVFRVFVNTKLVGYLTQTRGGVWEFEYTNHDGGPRKGLASGSKVLVLGALAREFRCSEIAFVDENGIEIMGGVDV